MWRSERLLLDKVMDRYPGPIELTQTRWVRIALLIGGAVWAIGFLLLAYPGIGDVDPDFSRDDQVLMGLLFAAPGVFAVVRSARDLRRPHRMVMDGKGFHVVAPGLDESYAWKNVDNFRVTHFARGVEYVVCDLVNQDRPAWPGSGYDVRIRDNFGLSYEALSSLMQTWKSRATECEDDESPSRSARQGSRETRWPGAGSNRRPSAFQADAHTD